MTHGLVVKWRSQTVKQRQIVAMSVAVAAGLGLAGFGVATHLGQRASAATPRGGPAVYGHRPFHPWRANWCGPAPGPLQVRITLSGGRGTVSGSVNGPPDSYYGPQCLRRNQSSTL